MAVTESLIASYGLLGIAVASFLSYSLLPVPTEPIVLAGMLYFNPWTVFVFILVGATLGSILNYYIGLKGIRLLFFNPSEKKQKKAEKLFDKWGPSSIILFSWLPLIGDPLVMAAGVLRMNFIKFLVYSTISKLLYFAGIVWLGIVVF